MFKNEYEPESLNQICNVLCCNHKFILIYHQVTLKTSRLYSMFVQLVAAQVSDRFITLVRYNFIDYLFYNFGTTVILRVIADDCEILGVGVLNGVQVPLWHKKCYS